MLNNDINNNRLMSEAYELKTILTQMMQNNCVKSFKNYYKRILPWVQVYLKLSE